MSIKKQYIKSKSVCKVTFSIDSKTSERVSVVGDFNDWNAEAGALPKLKSGTFKATFDLPIDVSYEFKYIVDGLYINDAEADAFVFNQFANAENGVVVL